MALRTGIEPRETRAPDGVRPDAVRDPGTQSLVIRLHERVHALTTDHRQAARAGFELLGAGPHGIAAGLDRLERRTRGSVWNMQRTIDYRPGSPYIAMTKRSRLRRVDMRFLVSPQALRHNPLFPYLYPYAATAPIYGPMMIVDKACIVLPGAITGNGEYTAWCTTRADLLAIGMEIWDRTSRVALPVAPDPALPRLHARHLQLAHCLVDGLTLRATASRIGAAERTVSDDLATLMTYLRVDSRTAALLRLLGDGIGY